MTLRILHNTFQWMNQQGHERSYQNQPNSSQTSQQNHLPVIVDVHTR